MYRSTETTDLIEKIQLESVHWIVLCEVVFQVDLLQLYHVDLKNNSINYKIPRISLELEWEKLLILKSETHCASRVYCIVVGSLGSRFELLQLYHLTLAPDSINYKLATISLGLE